MKKLKQIIFLILALLIASSIFIGCQHYLLSDVLSIHMIDVEQGESILIITPNNRSILIDGGELSQGRKVKAYLAKNGVKKIDLLVATHPHSDHIGGLPQIINSFKIEEIIMPKVTHNSGTFENLLNTIKANDLTITSPKSNSIVQFDEDIKLHFLSPINDYGDNLNLWSIVFRLDYKDKSFLFTGDMEYPNEVELLSTYNKEALKANVLNIAHHGSNTSTSKEFLEMVNPEVAIISLGKDNPYGHPHKEVIERLEKSNIFIYRTDLQGTVILLSDGIEIWSNQPPSNKKDNFQKLP